MKVKIINSEGEIISIMQYIGFSLDAIGKDFLPEEYKEKEVKLISFLTESGIAARYVIEKEKIESIATKALADETTTVTIEVVGNLEVISQVA